MRVRHLLLGCIALAFALVAARLVVLELRVAQGQALDRFQLEVERISRDSASLLVLSQDYLLHNSPRAARQWHVVHAELTRGLPAVLPDSAADLREEIDALREVVHGLPALFDAVESAALDADRAKARIRLETLAGHLVAETRRVSDGAFALAERLVEVRRTRELVERHVAWATMAAFATLVLAISVVVARRVLRPLAGLEAVAQAVRSGTPGVRSDYRAADEFGSLSRAFDAMTQTLEERAATLSASNRQLLESETSLAAARRDLQHILDAVPSAIGYCDRSLRVGFANQACEAWFGIDPDRLRGMAMRDVLGDRYEIGLPYMQAALRGEPQVFERTVPIPGGSGERHALGHYVPDVVDGEVRGFYVLMHDITQQTRDKARLAAALRENEALLSTIRLHTIYSVTDPAGRITDLNDSFCQTSGYRREELLGQDHRIVSSGTHDNAFWAELWRVISGGQPWRGEICNRRKDGTLYWVQGVIAPFVGDAGQIEKYVFIRTDTSATKLAEQALQLAHDRFSIAADSAEIGVWEFDPVANTLVWDERMYRLYRRERSGGIEPYALWEESVHPDDKQRSVELLGAALRGECDFDPEFRIVRPDGEVRYLKASARVLRDARGAPLRMTGVNIDITERKRAERELQSRERLTRLVINSLPGPVAYWNAELRCTIANHAYREWLGLDPEQMVGRTQRELFGEETCVKNEPHMRAALRGEEQRLERSRVTLDGRTRHYLLHYLPDRDGAEVRGFISVVIDVSQLKDIQRQLELRTRQAEDANLAKSRFLANMSHEIRSPMNAVIGLAYLLGQTPLDAQQADLLAKLGLWSKALLATINDVLDLSKIEAGEVMVERAPFRLQHVLKDIAGVMAMQAQAKAITFEIDAASDLPAELEGDSMRLTQILINLASNAVKFTERGGVRVAVSMVAATPQGVRLAFVVSDSGIGIAPDVQARLFAPFAQADASMTRRFGGTGLGLSIVKHLAELMGGSVSLVSRPGEGSEFSVELEFGRVAAGAVAPRPAAAPLSGQRLLPGVRVLVVDDSDINREVARRILELDGARVTLAENGEQACEQLRAAPQAFDLVLMDVQMPVLDGYDATRRIRHELGLADLPIIALTAGALTSERQRAVEAGMNDFITKPFDPRALVRSVRRHVSPAGAGPEAVPDTQPAGGEPWPEIEAIDSLDVSARLGGDTKLFRSMLSRLLDESADVDAVVADASDPAMLARQAARLHKLRGGAGMLGAKQIQRLAGEAEAACRAADGELAAGLTARLAAQLRALGREAAPFLDALPPRLEEEPAAGSAEVDPQVLAELVALLRQKNLAALERFAAVSAQLRQRLGAESHARLRMQVENLQFDAAARAIEAEAALRPAGSPRSPT